jgi:hypothetical protein
MTARWSVKSNNLNNGKQSVLLVAAFVVSAVVVMLIPFLLVPTIPFHQTSLPRHKLPSQQAFQQAKTNTVAKSLVNTTSTSSRPIRGVQQPATSTSNSNSIPKESCAILFFGLPRSFQLLVLPSIVKNVLLPNKENQCDIFLHYYDSNYEEGGSRSGNGGTIDASQVWLLPDAVAKVYGTHTPNNSSSLTTPRVSITVDTDETFWQKRGPTLDNYRNAKNPADGNFLYYPWMAKSFLYPTSMDNIVKQWHSIDAVWNNMVHKSKLWNKNYTRVAMLRNDVMFVTPFNIYQLSEGNDDTIPPTTSTFDHDNQKVAVPNWARFPINDRMIYGPYKAIQIWATERFTRLEDHVRSYEPGYGMHSERFLNHSIFPAIRNELGLEVVFNPDICFFRARADGSVWINDCTTRDGAARGFRKTDTLALVESIIERKCVQSKYSKRIIQARCDDNDEQQQQHQQQQSKQLPGAGRLMHSSLLANSNRPKPT